METILLILGGILFLAFVAAGVISIVFGLPGTLIILASVFIFWLVDSTIITGTAVIIVLIMTLIAEGAEFLLGVYGSQKYGSSRAAMIGALVGGLAGAILGAPIGLGLGAIPGAFLGSFAGAYAVEYYKERDRDQAMQSGKGAFWGRVAGTVVKGSLAMGMAILCIIALFFAAL